MVEKHQVAVLILVESEIPAGEMLSVLNRQEVQFHFPFSNCEKIAIYTGFSGEFIRPLYESHRITIRQVVLPSGAEFLLTAVHMPSKLHFSEKSQISECINLANAIREVEEKLGHRKTVLVGDFNMNPFEYGVIAANGLHAVMTKDITLRRERMVQDKPYPFFYNPMWGHWGDANETPAGTYYYEKAEHDVYFWNLFDQVMLRPDVLPFFRNDDLKILTACSGKSLMTDKGLPDKDGGSDHLPILFTLNF